MAANVMAAASMVTPQGAAKKVIKEGVEQAGEQLAKHTDDVIDVAKTTPTPPAQLADEIASAGTGTVGAPKPGVGTPQMSTGPPRSADDRIPLEVPYGPIPPPTSYRPPSVSQPACTRNDCGHVSQNPATIYSENYTPGTYNNKLSGIESGRSSVTVHREADPSTIRRNRRAAQKDVRSTRDYVRDEDNPASTKEGGAEARIDYVPQWEGPLEGNQLKRTYDEQGIRDGDPYDRVFRGDDEKVRCAQCAISRRRQQQQQDSATDAARTQALDNARSNGAGDRSSQQGNSTAGDNNRKSGSKKQSSKKNEKKKKKQSSRHKKRKRKSGSN